MDLAYLIRFAETMTRNAFAYRKTQSGESIDAYWHGKDKLILTVQLGDQWYSLSKDKADNLLFAVAKQEQVISKTPLTKHEFLAYPSIDHLFHYGDTAISTWLESCHWDTDEGYNDNFPDPAADRYDRWFQQQDPFYNSDDVYFISHGWSFIWPEDDSILEWDPELDFTLITLKDAEPWYEVWFNKTQNNFVVLERTT